MQSDVSNLGPWAEAEWLALLQEGERWRLELTRVELPEGLEERLLRIPSDRRSGAISRMLGIPRLAWAAMAAAVVLAVCAWFVLGDRESQPTPVEALARLAVNDHVETHTLDVRGDAEPAVASGLRDRIPFEIRFPDFGGGLAIEGGRLCTLRSHPVCFTTWRRDGVRLTLLQLRRIDFGLPADLSPTVVAPEGTAASRPLDVLVWTTGEFGYALVADEPSALRGVRPVRR
jgi:hypothetical protein